MKIEFKIPLKIQKPIREVFDAVAAPERLCVYFTSSATGPLEAGKTIYWKFAEFPEMNIPVTVHEVEPEKLIRFEWPTNDEESTTTVTFTFEEIDKGRTEVTVAESGWRDTEKGRVDSYLNCYGWTHMLCCLKAYLEHDIDLRAGSF